MTKISRTVEKDVFDRAKGICQICGTYTDFRNGNVEHIRSVRKGGSDAPENLQWSCGSCNKHKGKNLTNEQVRRKLGLPEKFEDVLNLRNSEVPNAKVDLRYSFDKFYGPIHSVLTNVTFKELKMGILSQSDRILLDDELSKKPIILPTSQEEWRLRIRNLDISSPLPIKFIEHFKNEYERRRGNIEVEKRFGNVYSILKNVSQKVKQVGILYPEEKTFIDEKFASFPDIPTHELHDCWKNEFHPSKLEMAVMEHVLTLLENPRPKVVNSQQSSQGLYLVPKTFITKFLQEYDKKRSQFNMP